MKTLSVSKRDEVWNVKADRLMKNLQSHKQRTECRKTVEELAILLVPGRPTPQKLSQLDTFSEECRSFTTSFYRPLLEAMLNVDPQDKMVICWIESGPAEETLDILVEQIKALVPSRRRDQVVDLISHLIGSDAFLLSTIAPSFNLTDRWQWEEDWVHAIASLPDVLGNILQRYLPRQLSPVCYYRTMAVQLARCLYILSQGMKYSVNVRVEPLAVLVTRLCAKVSPSFLLEPLVELVNSLTSENFIARRLWTALVRLLDDRCLEQVVTYLAKWAKTPSAFQRLAGIPQQFPLEDRWHRLLCSKLLLLRGLTCLSIGRNVLTCLSSHPATLSKVTNDLLSVWSEKNALLFTSPEQHEFITKCLIIALDLLRPEELALQRMELHRMLRQGVSHHLESPRMSVRIQGMFVAEVCTKRIHPDGPTLAFTYDKSDPLVVELQQLLLPTPEEEECCKDFETVLETVFSDVVVQPSIRIEQTKLRPSTSTTTTTQPVDLDSDDDDDDFEPYDMTDDTVESKYETPYYIRDLMDMLGNTQNEAEEFEKLRLALGACEDIVRQQLPREHPSLVAQLLAILIHLEDKYSLPDFVGSRQRSLVAVCVTQPTESARYLCTEFYRANYTVVQRLDMLHAISAAAQELSSQQQQQPVSTTEQPKTEPDDWRQVVQKRIEANTRWISQKRHRPVTQQNQNRFTPFAGLFFFPLAGKIDHCLVHMSLIDQDYVLLSTLVRTLTTILHCTGPVPVVAERMIRSLIDMVWYLRLHREPSVREASMAAFIQCLLASSNHNQLMANHALEIADWKDWLCETMERDPSTQVRFLAQQAVSLLAHLLHQ